MKLVFFTKDLLKAKSSFPVGHITTSKTGQKMKKIEPGKWIPVGIGGAKKKEEFSGKSVPGLIFKEGFYFDGKTKITNNYEKAIKYSENKKQNGKFPSNEKKNVKIGDTIRVKAHAKSDGKITEHKARGMVAKVKEIGEKFVKIVDDTGRIFQVNKTALEFAKSQIFVNDYNLIKTRLVFNLQKARQTKYIKRISKPGGGYKYIYKKSKKLTFTELKKNDDQLKIGIKIEKEHKDLVKKIRDQLKKHGTVKLTDNEIYKMIAKEHLKGNSNYYKLLQKYIEPIHKSKKTIFSLFKSKNKLNKLKKVLIKILEKNIEKSSSLNIIFFDLIKGRGYPVGTKREWRGKKFIKISKGKWRRFYEGESRGEKQSLRYIKKKILEAKTISELAKIVFENRKRFVNPDGSISKVVSQLLELAKSKKPESKKIIFQVKDDKKEDIKLISTEKATLRALSRTMKFNISRTILVDYFEKETMKKLDKLGYFKISEIIKEDNDYKITFMKIKESKKEMKKGQKDILKSMIYKKNIKKKKLVFFK